MFSRHSGKYKYKVKKQHEAKGLDAKGIEAKG